MVSATSHALCVLARLKKRIEEVRKANRIDFQDERNNYWYKSDVLNELEKILGENNG